MSDNRSIDLAKYRLNDASERIDSSKLLISQGMYKDSLNRSYYAIFNTMRAVLALESLTLKDTQA